MCFSWPYHGLIPTTESEKVKTTCVCISPTSVRLDPISDSIIVKTLPLTCACKDDAVCNVILARLKLRCVKYFGHVPIMEAQNSIKMS